MERKNIKLIASGSNSQIYLYSAAGAALALKVVPASCPKEAAHLVNEFKVLSTLDHEFIIKAVKYQENHDFNGKKQNSQLRDERSVLAMEFATKGSLLEYLRSHRPSKMETKQLFKKVCLALKHLHLKGYSHRDLKLDNVLMFEDGPKCYPKLSDFGFASYCFKDGEKIQFKQFRGTQKAYMAPEIHNVRTDPDGTYDAMKADIFSLGVMMFAVTLGRLPFEYGKKSDKLYSLIHEQKAEEFWESHCKSLEKAGFCHGDSETEQFKDLFLRMVSSDPEARPSIGELLESQWFEY